MVIIKSKLTRDSTKDPFQLLLKFVTECAVTLQMLRFLSTKKQYKKKCIGNVTLLLKKKKTILQALSNPKTLLTKGKYFYNFEFKNIKFFDIFSYKKTKYLKNLIVKKLKKKFILLN